MKGLLMSIVKPGSGRITTIAKDKNINISKSIVYNILITNDFIHGFSVRKLLLTKIHKILIETGIK
jgi:hypothetical protein